ncbi:MAG: efflux RND transporter periplasmic adaptor subunit [Candidatus Omnitrophota bacterium]
MKNIREILKKASAGFRKIKFKLPQDRKKTIFIALIALVAVIVIVKTTSNINRALFKKSDAAKKTPAVTFEEEAAPVKVFKAKKIEFKDTLPCMGNIKGFKEIDLKFQVPGILESFNFEEGEKVQEGDIIASLVQKEALLKLKYTEIETSKNQKLFDIGAINTMKLEQSKLEYESAKNELDKTNIYAVSNGLLGSRLLDPGNFVTQNDKIGVFINIDKVRAEFSVIEKDMPKVSIGQKAEVFVDSHPNKAFSGTVDNIAPIVEGRSRTQNIKIDIDNKDGVLKPGMFARALVATYEKKDALVIPASGLKKKEAEYFVYLVLKEEPKKEAGDDKSKAKAKKLFGLFALPQKKEEPKPEAAAEKGSEYGTVEIRPVKLAYMTQDLVEIGEGLKEDDLIVAEIQEDFKDKAKVEITEVQEGLF